MRVIHRLRAFIGGYFWLPCPRCGEMFGGHQCTGTLWISDHTGWRTCPNCPGDYYEGDDDGGPPHTFTISASDIGDVDEGFPWDNIR